MQRYCTLVFALAVIFTSLSYGQNLESYIERKKNERKEPNQFMTGESMDRTSQLGTFYRRSFKKNQQQQGFQYLQGSGLGTSSSQNLNYGLPLEGAIDPATYIVGPGDGFVVNVWGALSLTLEALITPEGSLLIPNIGEVMVAGKTLREAKTIAVQKIKTHYNKADASVTLVSPRIFSVHVSGIVANPGKIEVSAIDRADKAVYLATLTEKLASDAAKLTAEPAQDEFVSITDATPHQLPQVSLRNIYILRGGDTLFVDLLGYYATGNLDYNPYLLDGDVVVVPAEQLDDNSISITGGVRLPGTFEYHPGDNLATAIQIAQGFKKNAVTENVVVARIQEGTDAPLLIDIRADGAGSNTASFMLQPGDKVFVRERPVTNRNASVSINGEVNYNGDFSIIEGKTTLRQVIQQAGGFTANAALAQAFILRKKQNQGLDPLTDNPDYRRLSAIRLSGLNKEERDYFTMEEAILREQVSVDFKRLFENNDASIDPALYDGDEIIVPSKRETVFLFGQVVRSGYVSWVQDMDADYYVEQAGGFSESANSSDMKVLKAGSKEWIDPDDTEIEPGDSIYIPRELDRDFAYYFTAVRDFLTVTVSAVTVYLLFVQIQGK